MFQKGDLRRSPHLYEINAFAFLRRLSQKHGRRLTLATVPDEEWACLAGLGFDLVWLMGVWRRSPRAHEQALNNVALRREYTQILPDWGEEDIVGSAFAVYDYSLDPNLGAPGELAELRQKLNNMGLGLILDFVPNHLALDHPWTRAHPDWFVRGSMADVRGHPEWFYWRTKGVYLAHGRDPYFPPWIDTAQVNFFSPGLRRALTRELEGIAAVADGVRCDMAMLALNSVFERVWGGVVKTPRPRSEFWADATIRIKDRHPGFVFLAEVYWDLEAELQRLGFDFTYDKRFYDRLFSSPAEVRRYLAMDVASQERMARFIENHDEPRAVIALGTERSMAAAVILATTPGLRLFYKGQLEGRRVRLPVQFSREPEEPVNDKLAAFYERLLRLCDDPVFHEGDFWQVPLRPSRPADESYTSLLAWCWRHDGGFRAVVVNYSASPAQGWLELPLASIKRLVIHEEPAGHRSEPEPSELPHRGFFVELGPYHAYVLELESA